MKAWEWVRRGGESEEKERDFERERERERNSGDTNITLLLDINLCSWTQFSPFLAVSVVALDPQWLHTLILITTGTATTGAAVRLRGAWLLLPW